MNALIAIIIPIITLVLLIHEGEGSVNADTVPAYFYHRNYHQQHSRRLYADKAEHKSEASQRKSNLSAFDNGQDSNSGDYGNSDGNDSGSGSDNEVHITTGGWGSFGGGSSTIWRCVHDNDVALSYDDGPWYTHTYAFLM